MKITTARKISQGFFLVVFLWFCIVATFGTEWWQLRGWPVNLFLQVDPLVAIAAMLTTHTIYKELILALITIIITIIFGRVFCGWVCPFGTMHHFLGFVSRGGKNMPDRISSNKYRKLQNTKYFILIAFIAAASLPIGFSTSLLTGFLDPLPLVYRSVNLTILPIIDTSAKTLSITPRLYEGAYIIGFIFIAALLMNFFIPRFYCRFICPLGALLGILGRYSIWRIGKIESKCTNCKLCEKACEGACEPAAKIRIPECVLCFNCLHDCNYNLIGYRIKESEAGEISKPDVGRRGFILAAVTGIAALPMIRLSGKIGKNWYYKVIRPPGALVEEEFLKRCIKCGQCMRICPTNIIMPGGLNGGLENVWTPVLNFRIGTSGCQLNCVACGYICPTSAIRPISLSEKLGINEFSKNGAIKIGTAFIDQGRCLPWSMKTPCIVCQENCPITPKAIFTEEVFKIVRDGTYTIVSVNDNIIEVKGAAMKPNMYTTGDYFLVNKSNVSIQPIRIISNKENKITIESGPPLFVSDDKVEVQMRLQLPYIDIEKCIGCGICEHECPVSGLRAVRISAENETRSTNRTLSLRKG